ncbi:MAG: endopeptidase La, partial [Gaiellales bacterium]
MPKLLLIPLEDTVVFPGMEVTLPVDPGDESQVLLVPRHESDYAKVGVVAEVGERMRLPGRIRAVQLSALHRGVAGAAESDPQGRLWVEVEERPDEIPPPSKTRELESEYRATVEEILELRGDDGRVSAFVRSITEPGALADTSGYAPDLTYEQKVELLQTVDVVERLSLALELQRGRLAELQIRKRIREDVESGAQKQQREYLLRRQMDSIRKELGEDDASVAEEYRTKIDEAGMPDDVREQAERELGRLERMGEQSGESSMIRTYLDWLIAVPWSKRSEERLDPVHAREVLDADHAGLDDVKERITEYLAVRKLRAERGVPDDRRSGVILTLIGPPGTGKTSIGESIARATGREFVRMSLGGVRDEAEIRGHRRTYIGAIPGRIVQALKQAGAMNPVFMLDEIDKIGAGFQCDPAAALLEVLDPAQNHAFRDHYLEINVDLSRVLFIATSNQLGTVHPALLDRMEIISLAGYSEEEKLHIARQYLIPRQLEEHGLSAAQAEIEDDAVRRIISDYTREAGVRNIERQIGAVLRKIAARIAASGPPPSPVIVTAATVPDYLGPPRFHDEVSFRVSRAGVATGVAWTETGGDVLFIEASLLPGGHGNLILTGQLGNVMQESARAALSHIRAQAKELGVSPDFLDSHDLHVHVPAGAIPKDGPSAGVTIATAILSAARNQPIREDVAMTGEITLSGLV